jgi:hypothetical protein
MVKLPVEIVEAIYQPIVPMPSYGMKCGKTCIRHSPYRKWPQPPPPPARKPMRILLYMHAPVLNSCHICTYTYTHTLYTTATVYVAYHQHRPLWQDGDRWGHSGRTQSGHAARTAWSRGIRTRCFRQNSGGTWELQVCVCLGTLPMKWYVNIHVL